MKTTNFFLALALLVSSFAFAQVGIGTTEPHASSILDVTSTEKGFLPPRMTSNERDGITNPATGLTIFNTDDVCLNVYGGFGWRSLCAVVGPTDVINPKTGRIWMDRNLGANRVATTSTDAAAYGDLYQWGRATEGHEKVFRVTGDDPTSGEYTTQATTPVPGTGGNAWDGLFITGFNNWLSPQEDNLWQGVNGTNNPCPAGFRLPSEPEWNNERLSWSSNNTAGAMGSPLRLPTAGLRETTGVFVPGTPDGFYWSSTITTSAARYLRFNSSGASMNPRERASGQSVRCIKD